MNNHLIILLSALTILGCQPSAKDAHLKDPIYRHLEAKLSDLDKILDGIDKELGQLDMQAPEDTVSVSTMKSAAYRANFFRLEKERTLARQERIFLRMSAQKRAAHVQKRVLAGEKYDAEKEFSEFKSRFQPGIVPRGTN